MEDSFTLYSPEFLKTNRFTESKGGKVKRRHTVTTNAEEDVIEQLENHLTQIETLKENLSVLKERLSFPNKKRSSDTKQRLSFDPKHSKKGKKSFDGKIGIIGIPRRDQRTRKIIPDVEEETLEEEVEEEENIDDDEVEEEGNIDDEEDASDVENTGDEGGVEFKLTDLIISQKDFFGKEFLFTLFKSLTTALQENKIEELESNLFQFNETLNQTQEIELSEYAEKLGERIENNEVLILEFSEIVSSLPKELEIMDFQVVETLFSELRDLLHQPNNSSKLFMDKNLAFALRSCLFSFLDSPLTEELNKRLSSSLSEILYDEMLFFEAFQTSQKMYSQRLLGTIGSILKNENHEREETSLGRFVQVGMDSLQIEKQLFEQLESLKEERKKQVQEFFEERKERLNSVPIKPQQHSRPKKSERHSNPNKLIQQNSNSQTNKHGSKERSGIRQSKQYHSLLNFLDSTIDLVDSSDNEQSHSHSPKYSSKGLHQSDTPINRSPQTLLSPLQMSFSLELK